MDPRELALAGHAGESAIGGHDGHAVVFGDAGGIGGEGERRDEEQVDVSGIDSPRAASALARLSSRATANLFSCGPPTPSIYVHSDDLAS